MLPLTVVTSILVARGVLGPHGARCLRFHGIDRGFCAADLDARLWRFGRLLYFQQTISRGRHLPDVHCDRADARRVRSNRRPGDALAAFGWLGVATCATPLERMVDHVPVLLALPLQGAARQHGNARGMLGDSWFSLNNRVMFATVLLTGGMLLSLVVVLKLGVQGAVLGIVVNNFLLASGIIIASVRRYRPRFRYSTRRVPTRVVAARSRRPGSRTWPSPRTCVWING